MDDGQSSHTVAFDLYDRPEIVDPIADRVLLYFKMQYANDGYRQANVVPGGYHLANNVAYRYLELLRATRAMTRFHYDVYGRFGLRYGGIEIASGRFGCSRRDRTSDSREAFSAFRVVPTVPYRRHMFDIARARSR